LEARLLKADFHGAIITVFRSKCPSYVGATGILVQETENTFKVVTVDDKLKVIPKAHSVFSLKLGELPHVATLYGNHFCYRSYERSGRKFKTKTTIEL